MLFLLLYEIFVVISFFLSFRQFTDCRSVGNRSWKIIIYGWRKNIALKCFAFAKIVAKIKFILTVQIKIIKHHFLPVNLNIAYTSFIETKYVVLNIMSIPYWIFPIVNKKIYFILFERFKKGKNNFAVCSFKCGHISLISDVQQLLSITLSVK